MRNAPRWVPGLLAFIVWTAIGDSVACQVRERRIDEWIKSLDSSDWRSRMSAAAGLGGAGAEARRALPALWKARNDPNQRVRRWASKAAERIFQDLQSDIPLEELVAKIAVEPSPPRFNRIPAHVHRGEKPGRSIQRGGLEFLGAPDDASGNGSPLVGVLLIRIPLPYAAKAHARYVGRVVKLGPSSCLEVQLTKGYLPQLWEEREIVAALELHGRFGRLRLPKLPEGRRWEVIYDDLDRRIDLDRDGRADVTLRVVSSQ